MNNRNIQLDMERVEEMKNKKPPRRRKKVCEMKKIEMTTILLVFFTSGLDAKDLAERKQN